MCIQGTVLTKALYQSFHLTLKQDRVSITLILLLSTFRRMIKSFLLIFIVDKQKLLRLENIKQISQDNLSNKKLIQDFNAHCPTPGLELFTTKTYCFWNTGTTYAYTDMSFVGEMSCINSVAMEHSR